MTYYQAIYFIELFFGLVLIQQSLEHLKTDDSTKLLFIIRTFFALLLAFHVFTIYVLLLIFLCNVFLLWKFRGPYNGGADRLGLLILFCLIITHLAPTQYWKEVVLGYLALQLVLSYFMAGWVKLCNPEWRSGRALQDVFQFSAYPSSEALRELIKFPKILFIASWIIIFLELIFPLSLFSQSSLILALILMACFHLANAYLFGLNRFFWIWLSAYPSLLWLQMRLSFII